MTSQACLQPSCKQHVPRGGDTGESGRVKAGGNWRGCWRRLLPQPGKAQSQPKALPWRLVQVGTCNSTRRHSYRQHTTSTTKSHALSCPMMRRHRRGEDSRSMRTSLTRRTPRLGQSPAHRFHTSPLKVPRNKMKLSRNSKHLLVHDLS
jgi:hypothetical protein